MGDNKDYSIVNILLGVALLATVVFIILSCFLATPVFPWLSLAFGVATLLLGMIRFFEW